MVCESSWAVYCLHLHIIHKELYTNSGSMYYSGWGIIFLFSLVLRCDDDRISLLLLLSSSILQKKFTLFVPLDNHTGWLQKIQNFSYLEYCLLPKHKTTLKVFLLLVLNSPCIIIRYIDIHFLGCFGHTIKDFSKMWKMYSTRLKNVAFLLAIILGSVKYFWPHFLNYFSP